MTGVEILAMEEVATAFGFDIVSFLIMLTVSVVFGALIGWLSDTNNFANGWFFGMIFSGAVGLILAIAIGVSSESKPIEYETRYKVIISDEVSMNDFLSKYEIIDQEGKIYTVREIKNGE
jgi:hypothetical protein